MTTGVIWEFFELTMDILFKTDMQKDTVIREISSVMFDPAGLNNVHHVKIESLIVNGEDWIAKYGGYIDIGLYDTMKDMFVNLIGAVSFSVIGYFYAHGQGKFAKGFIPVAQENVEAEAALEEILD